MAVTDPLHTALAAALAPHGITDPAAITAAADTAVAMLGRDRCTCRASIHQQHHHTHVDGCPWCAKALDATQPAASGMAVVPTGGVL